MPTYQYACTECGHRFDVVQSFRDDALTECPRCRGRLRKVFSPVGVVFKGSGFYRTDSRPASGEKSSTDGGGVGKKDKEGVPPAGGSKAPEGGGSGSGSAESGTSNAAPSTGTGSSTAGSAA